MGEKHDFNYPSKKHLPFSKKYVSYSELAYLRDKDLLKIFGPTKKNVLLKGEKKWKVLKGHMKMSQHADWKHLFLLCFSPLGGKTSCSPM